MKKETGTSGSYHAENLAFVLLTHAHIDHSGLIPKLVKEGFHGKVFCTKATFDLCEVMLRDSGHIQEMEAEWQNRKGKRSGKKRIDPLYTVKDAEACLRYFQPVRYDELFSPAEGIKVKFRDAGHILGSAIIEIWIEDGGSERKLVFSGDLGSPDQPIVRDPTWIEEADLLWLESTYGDRLHKSRDETVQELFQIIRQAIQDQAKVIIPAFAVERTQDVIFTLGQLIRKGLIPSIPVYIDSPLAISATEIFKKNSDCFDRETREILSSGENPLALPGSSIRGPPRNRGPSMGIQDRGLSSLPAGCAIPGEFCTTSSTTSGKNPPISSSWVIRLRDRSEEGLSMGQKPSGFSEKRSR